MSYELCRTVHIPIDNVKETMLTFHEFIKKTFLQVPGLVAVEECLRCFPGKKVATASP